MTEPGPAQKSADAYRTISEVAADLKLPQHVLRFWETRFSQVKPLKRAGGRRFYRPEDVDLLRAVKALLYGDGYTIKGVQRILREQGPKAIAALAASPAHRRTPPQPEVAPHAALPISGPVPSLRPPAAAEPPASVALLSDGDGPADRLRVVLADLEDCARLLAHASRSAS